MQSRGCVVTAMLLGALGGCAEPPPPPQSPPLLVAYPGPTKTTAQFQADDAVCRSAASHPAGAIASGPGSPMRAPTTSGGNETPSSATPDPAAPQLAGTPPTPPSTPGTVYLQCMAAHYNIVQPVAPDVPVAYTYYDPYPVYLGFGDYYPFLYGGYFGFGYFGRYGGYRGFHGYRGGYGFRDGFGYRGGYGFRDGGFRNGGGFHDGGGFHEGGFGGGSHGGFAGGFGRR